MAKRKSAGAAKRKAAGARARTSQRRTARKTAARKTTARAGASRRAGAGGRKATSKKAARKTTTRTSARKSAASKRPAPKPAAAQRRGRAAAARPRTLPTRRAPALDRERRMVEDEDLVPTPPSSLDLDRSASAVRSGRRGLRDRYDEHTETSPALTGGDVDADWESAYSVGDEAPGGDNPTPDQDIVDDIGRAVGVEYEDTEELKGEKKISDRDKKRWELDPASAEDYNDR